MSDRNRTDKHHGALAYRPGIDKPLSVMSCDELRRRGFTHHCPVHQRFWQGQPKKGCCNRVEQIEWHMPPGEHWQRSTLASIAQSGLH
jgi:hypothetical protein